MTKLSKKEDNIPESVTDKERLIFIFQTLIKEGQRLIGFEGNALIIEIKKLNVKPYFDCKDTIFLEEEFRNLLLPIKDDLDFFRRHDMRDYKPDFNFESFQGFITFYDYTDDFMKLYMEDKLGVKSDSKINGNYAESKSISIKEKKVEFDEVTSTITINGKKCPLPPATNIDYLARAMFSREVGEPVDWSIIYREMTGSQAVIGSKTNKKSVEDTVLRLNQKIQNIFGTEDKLISCKNKSIIRNY